MEDSHSQPVETGQQSMDDDPMYSFSPESTSKVESSDTACEAMDTNNNNNAIPEESYAQGKIEQENDPFSKPGSTVRTGQASKLSVQAGLVSPPEFRSRTETPVSSSQLLNIPSSALFALEGLDFNTPMGSSLISPLASARIGRKRQLSISPLSSSSIDLNSLIRTSPTSLVNYITNSRSSSAGSIGHLSPSFFSKTNRLQTPHARPLQVSLRNSGYPQPSALDTTLENSETDIKQEPSETSNAQLGDCMHDVKMEPGMAPMLRDCGSHMPSNLETVCEEPSGDVYSSEDEANPAQQDCEAEIDSKKGITDDKSKRVYYNYPSVEDPHHNQCRWDDCTHQCDTLEALVHHVNSEHIYHDSRKEFVCYWNGCVREKKPFKAQYMLLVHMRRHTGEKPHKCTYDGCSKAYSRLENLKTHLRSHTGERPYVCKFEGCSKAFSNASDCAKHMNRTHTDEKPYACPNPGCTKRYTDPSSRRKHVKNCQVNKRARTGDPDSTQPEEVASPEQKSTTAKKTTKPRKPEKRKSSGPPSASANQFPALVPQANGGPSLTDHGYFSGSSQGYASSQLSYNSLPESESDFAKLRGDEEISHILQQQRLSDPHDNATQSNFGRPLSRHFPLDRHVNEHVDPNVRASRQNAGELTLPAGTIHPTPPHSQFPHIPSHSYHSSHSKYSQYHNTRHSHQSSSNPRMSRTNSLPSAPYMNGRRVSNTNGHSGYAPYSPSGAPGPRKSPSDDGSIASGGLQSSNMTNSYSTFSSNSSRVSSPSSNSGRSDMHAQNGYTSFRAHYPLKQHLKMISSFGQRDYFRRQSSDTYSESSWKSSQSSRYSVTGSELSDDVLESLPASARKSSFSRAQPLPLPESMQDGLPNVDFETGYMDVFSSQQMPNSDPSTYSQMTSDSLGQPNSDPLATLPLYHIDGGGNAMEITAEVNGFSASFNGGLFSQEAPSDEHDFLFRDPYTASTNNMMIGDMSTFAGALTEENHYFEQLVNKKST